MNEPVGRFGSFRATSAATNCLGNGGHGSILADDAFVKVFFHLQQSQTVFGRQSRQWNAGHLADDFGDDFFIDHAIGLLTLFTPVLSDLLFLLAKLFCLITQVGGFFKVLVGDRVFFFLVQFLDFFVDLFQVWRTGHGAQVAHGHPLRRSHRSPCLANNVR